MDRYYVHQSERVQSLLYRVFGWMSFALLLTGATSYYVSESVVLRTMLFKNPFIFFGLLIAQLVLVIILSAAIFKIGYFAAFTMFSLYSILTGVTLSTIFIVYTTVSIVTTFFVAAGMFASMAIYGAVTKANLTAMGSFLGMALWGLILALVVNIFLRSPMFDLITAMVGVVIFAGLTAYDIQKIKVIAEKVDASDGAFSNIALIAALQLYLDFINLFLSLLRIMGNRKE